MDKTACFLQSAALRARAASMRLCRATLRSQLPIRESPSADIVDKPQTRLFDGSVTSRQLVERRPRRDHDQGEGKAPSSRFMPKKHCKLRMPSTRTEKRQTMPSLAGIPISVKTCSMRPARQPWAASPS